MRAQWQLTKGEWHLASGSSEENCSAGDLSAPSRPDIGARRPIQFEFPVSSKKWRSPDPASGRKELPGHKKQNKLNSQQRANRRAQQLEENIEALNAEAAHAKASLTHVIGARSS